MENIIEIKYTVEQFLEFDMYDLCEFCIRNNIEIDVRNDSKIEVIYSILNVLCPEAIIDYENNNNWNELRVDYYTSYSFDELMRYTDEAILNETLRVCADLELKPDKKWSKEDQCKFLIKVCDMNKFTEEYILPNSLNNKDDELIECDDEKEGIWNKSRKELREICVQANIPIDNNWKKGKLVKVIKENNLEEVKDGE